MRVNNFASPLLAALLTLVPLLVLGGCSGDPGQDAPQGEAPPAAQAAPASLISGMPQEVPIPGMVTMVDIGAHACIPCKMMTPIIEELSGEYASRAAIVFIDVWEHREQAERFGINAIPTQIFYDADGKERMRHTGFLDKASIIQQLAAMGVE